MIKGKGIQAYRTYFEKGEIKENDVLITDSELEFYVNENGTLNWANVTTKENLIEKKLDGDLDNILVERILARKKWWIEKRS